VQATMEEEKRRVLELAKQYLDSLSQEELNIVSFKTVRQHLQPLVGDTVSQFKDDIREYIAAHYLPEQNIQEAVTTENIQDTIDDNGNQDDGHSEEESSDDETDDPKIAGLSEEWKSQYGDIVWVRESKRDPW
jgi:hypothetical protein